MRVKSLQLKRFKWISLSGRGETFHTILETAVTSIPSMQPGFSQENKHKAMDPEIMYTRINKQNGRPRTRQSRISSLRVNPPYSIGFLKQTIERGTDLALVFQGRNQFEEENQQSRPGSGFCFSRLCPLIMLVRNMANK